MIRVAATSTDVRKQKLMSLITQLKVNQSRMVKGFGLEIDDKFSEVNARILDPPSLKYGNNRVLTPVNGVWRGEQIPFLQPVTGKPKITWGVLVFDSRVRRSEVETFCAMVYISFKYVLLHH